ncbi:MAG: BrnT family toxin [Methylococcales bacterium]|nr:MAG: BrnT family toxin [Methylococcales bacterium]
MKIEFDPDKAATNPLNHDGVTFDEAKAALLDPYALTREDSQADNEQRFITLGMGAKNRILVVVWTLRDETVRLISAWKANQPQRKYYEQQF